MICIRILILLFAGYLSVAWSDSYAEAKAQRSVADQSLYQFINDAELATRALLSWDRRTLTLSGRGDQIEIKYRIDPNRGSLLRYRRRISEDWGTPTVLIMGGYDGVFVITTKAEAAAQARSIAFIQLWMLQPNSTTASAVQWRAAPRGARLEGHYVWQ